ncbi:MAG: MoxR family ATPase [Proteobacteria bacterium]|nr:MoxR family ATPase [Pseudomonadota bacterium]MCP4921008.1 MoxR family ATPase [Pseudomonadota bacterium]
MAEPARSAERIARIAALRARIEEVVQGKPEVVELTVVAVLAGGHVLLEDVPGVGKTTLASSVAAALGGTFNRVQFTSDLLPADVVGAVVLEPSSGSLAFRPGPVFANVVLADEINRCTPKTQSALLEAMNERRVSVDGRSHELPDPFLVIATQNPHDHTGTFPLPESQLDRFLLRLSMGYPGREAERAVLRAGGFRRTRIEAAVTPEDLRQLADGVSRVTVHAEVEDYLLDLIAATRSDSRLLRGASTRGAEALYRACKALAFVRGREFVVPEDIRELAVAVLAHRVIARGEDVRAAEQAVREILWDLPAPE